MSEPGLQVTVSFPPEVPLTAQGPALLHFEQKLRAATHLDVRVVKALMGDDSKLRVKMTPIQRLKL